MVLFHAAFFWPALLLLSRATRLGPFARGVIIVVFAAFPAVSFQLGMIWKDTGLSCSYFLGSVLLIRFGSSFVPLLLAALLFAYGTCVRFDGIAAFLPVACWMAQVLGARYHWRLIHRQRVVNGLVHKSGMSGQRQMTWSYDLGGLSVRTNQNLFPEPFSKRVVLSELAPLVNSHRIDYVAGFKIPYSRNDDISREL